jgi:hypothetical protein
LPFGLRDFAQLVIPEPAAARAFSHTAYTGRTLREHLGLWRPPHPSRQILEAVGDRTMLQMSSS